MYISTSILPYTQCKYFNRTQRNHFGVNVILDYMMIKPHIAPDDGDGRDGAGGVNMRRVYGTLSNSYRWMKQLDKNTSYT